MPPAFGKQEKNPKPPMMDLIHALNSQCNCMFNLIHKLTELNFQLSDVWGSPLLLSKRVPGEEVCVVHEMSW